MKSCKNTLWDLIVSAAGDLVRDSTVAYVCLPDLLSFSLSWVMAPRFPRGMPPSPPVCVGFLRLSIKVPKPILDEGWAHDPGWVVRPSCWEPWILSRSDTGEMSGLHIYLCSVAPMGCQSASALQSVMSDSVTPSMDCSMPGFPVLHYLLELAQIHVHWVSDAIQLSHPLSSPSPSAFSLPQHQDLF